MKYQIYFIALPCSLLFIFSMFHMLTINTGKELNATVLVNYYIPTFSEFLLSYVYQPF